jgi:hypothetical protein
MRNLDVIAAETAQAIIEGTKGRKSEDVDNLATKALGVLQENGVYAGMLFLLSRTGADQGIAQVVRDELLKLLTEKLEYTGIKKKASAAEILQSLTKHICQDLDTLLLVKQVWEQTLIYTRYSAKARKAEKDKEAEDKKAQQEGKAANAGTAR